MTHYEAIIIGGGGGLKLRPIANLGHNIAIIEKEDLGGTCLNRGCIPSKMLIHPADLLDQIRDAAKFDLNVDPTPSANFKDLITRVNTSVHGTSQRIADAYEKNSSIDYFHGEAQFIDNKTVEVNGQQLTANRIFIATGSRPRIPTIEGLEGTPFMTSREALSNPTLPKKMIVIGGGYIGVELGHFYRSMGSEVHFLVRSQLLRQEDDEVVEEFVKAFEKKHTLHFGVTPTKVSHDGSEFTVTVQDKDGNPFDMTTDALMVATGIVPNSDNLGLKHTGIELNQRGFIKVDDHLQTTVPGVYALGDVIGNHFFRHSVNFEGEYLLRTLYTHPCKAPINYPPMPHAVFSNPQIAAVGATEQDLKAQKVDYIAVRNDYKDSAKGGDVLQSEHGFVKLLFHKKTQYLLGAHIIGEEASTLIHMLIVYLTSGATLNDMQRMIYIHPALPEVVRNAVRKAAAHLENAS